MTTYTELVDQIRAYTETDSNVLTTTIINDFIEHAENRIFREVDLDAFRSYQIAALTAGNGFVYLPGLNVADFALIRSVQIYGQSLANTRRTLEQRAKKPIMCARSEPRLHTYVPDVYQCYGQTRRTSRQRQSVLTRIQEVLC